MGVVTAAVIGAVGVLGAASMSKDAANSAANKAKRGTDAAIAEQQAAREQFQTNVAPFLQFGQSGIPRLQALLDDPNSIQDSAAYQWRFNQGLQGLDRSAAARGNMFGGGHQADVVKFGQGLASQEYDSQWNRLWNIAAMGQNAAVGAGTAAQNTANAIGSLQVQQGINAGNAAIAQGNAYGSALQGLAGLAGQYMGNRSAYQQPTQQTNWGAFTPTTQTATQPSYTGFNPQTGSAFGTWGQGWGG